MKHPTCNPWLVWLGAMVFVLATLLAVRAFAHDKDHPELDDWFMGLHNKSHVACCDGSDAQHLSDVDWDSKDGHYRVKIDGDWYDVPDEAVIDTPNRAGTAMVWPYTVWQPSGKKTYAIRCFLPGSGA